MSNAISNPAGGARRRCSAEVLRRALTRLSNGDAAGPLGAVLDLVEGGAR